MKKVAIVMGSDSDLPVVEKAIDTLKEFAVPFEVHVFSAHRTPEQAKRLPWRQGRMTLARNCSSRKGCASCGSTGGKHYFTSDWHSGEILDAGWFGCAAFYCANARGDSCGNCGH